MSLLKKREITPFRLFIIFGVTGIVSFFCFALIRGAYAFDWISIGNTGGLHFIDYFNHVYLAATPTKIYELAPPQWGNFPPFAYLLYRFAFLIALPADASLENIDFITDGPYYLPLFLFYSIVTILILTYAVRIWDKEGKHLRTVVCLLFSVPFFAGGVERGNSIVLVLALLIIAVKWKDSDSKIKREAALLLIAISAGFKIYPAVLGFLYLKEHRFKEALRLMLYGFCVLLLPFYAFGGHRAFVYWIAQIKATAAVTNHFARMQYVRGIFFTLSYLLTGTTGGALPQIMSYVFLFMMLALALFSASKYRTVFFLCSIMIFFPDNSHRYTLSYYTIPLLLLLDQYGAEKKQSVFIWIETVCFSFLFSIPMLWGALTGFELKISEVGYYTTHVEFFIYIAAYLLLATCVVHELVDIFKYKRYTPFLKKKDTKTGVEKNEEVL